MISQPIFDYQFVRKIRKDLLLDMHARYLFIIKRDFSNLVK